MSRRLQCCFVSHAAGCGGSSAIRPVGSPAQILAASRAAATHASAVHIQTTASQGPLTLNTDLQLTAAGGRARLKFERLSYEVIRIGNTIYLKGAPGLYKRLIAGSNVQVPGLVAQAARVHRQPRPLCGAHQPARPARPPAHGRPVHQGTTTTINGQKAIELHDTGKLFTARCTSPPRASHTPSRSSSRAAKPAAPPSPAGTSPPD